MIKGIYRIYTAPLKISDLLITILIFVAFYTMYILTYIKYKIIRGKNKWQIIWHMEPHWVL